MQMHDGEVIWILVFLTPPLDGVSRQLHTPVALLPAKETPIIIRCWVEPRDGMDDMKAIPELEPQPIGRPARSQSI
jgi:hypothetical protein